MNRFTASWRVILTAALLSLVPYLSAQQYGSNTEAALERARQAAAAGKYAEAVKEYRNANKLERGSCSACLAGLASAYLRLGDGRNAEENASKAIATAHDAAERLAAHRIKGYVLMMTMAPGDAKRLAAAEKEFRAALSENATDGEARFGLGAALLKQSKDADGVAELQALLSAYPNSAWSEQAERLIANPRRAREWFAPEFEATSLQGETLSLRQLQGKIVVLDFWATWCPPCRASIPEIKDLLKKYPREKLVVISISADENIGVLKEFIASKGMDWPQIFDGNHRLADSFKVHSFPTYLVIDGEGVVRQKIVGLNERESVAYRLKQALKDIKELN
ncbi:MAG: redoxin domain-containing protein [Terriglobales bacterium]